MGAWGRGWSPATLLRDLPAFPPDTGLSPTLPAEPLRHGLRTCSLFRARGPGAAKLSAQTEGSGK